MSETGQVQPVGQLLHLLQIGGGGGRINPANRRQLHRGAPVCLAQMLGLQAVKLAAVTPQESDVGLEVIRERRLGWLGLAVQGP